jgi:hypothetical protein
MAQGIAGAFAPASGDMGGGDPWAIAQSEANSFFGANL